MGRILGHIVCQEAPRVLVAGDIPLRIGVRVAEPQEVLRAMSANVSVKRWVRRPPEESLANFTFLQGHTAADSR